MTPPSISAHITTNQLHELDYLRAAFEYNDAMLARARDEIRSLRAQLAERSGLQVVR